MEIKNTIRSIPLPILFFLFASVLSIIYFALEGPIRVPAFVGIIILAIVARVYIFSKGGMIPTKEGKRTIHSKIIFGASMFGVLLILSICIYFYFTLYY